MHLGHIERRAAREYGPAASSVLDDPIAGLEQLTGSDGRSLRALIAFVSSTPSSSGISKSVITSAISSSLATRSSPSFPSRAVSTR